MQAVAAATGSFPSWTRRQEDVPAREQQPIIMEQHEAAKRALGYV
jgi:xylulokinase